MKRGVVQLGGETQYIIQLIDISPKIFYDELKAEEEFTAIINSTISHEMRNPLNSIINSSGTQKEKLR